MKKIILLFFFSCFYFTTILYANYDRVIKIGDISYGCYEIEDSSSPGNLLTHEYCQYPDPEGGECLFISMIYIYNEKSCEEYCQHFSAKEKECLFKTVCTEVSGYFCKKTCVEFDDKKGICLTTAAECY